MYVIDEDGMREGQKDDVFVASNDGDDERLKCGFEEGVNDVFVEGALDSCDDTKEGEGEGNNDGLANGRIGYDDIED